MSSSSKTEEEKKEEEVRLLKVGGWEWKSDAIEEGKCRKGREWDWEKVVKRLVASPAGIVFLGGKDRPLSFATRTLADSLSRLQL